VSAGRGGFRRLSTLALAAAALAAGSGAGVGGPASVQASSGMKNVPAVPTAPTQVLRNFGMPTRSFQQVVNGYEPVWVGRGKRGNRRGRTRFTYFR
jgi:hypothetical protein